MTHYPHNSLFPETDYFVLSTVYDAETNGAGIKLFDVERKKVIYTTDTYGHEPYCYSYEPLEKIQALNFPPETVKRIETIKKRNLLKESEDPLTKIITPTPSEVPKVRDIVGETWESRIKYHRNWIYDIQIVPGRRYWWDPDQNKFIPSQSKSHGLDIPKSVNNQLSKYSGLLEVFRDDFIQEIPDMPIVACDIETESIEGQIPQAADPKYPIICICFADNQGKEIALVLNRKERNKGIKPIDTSPHLQVERFDAEEDLLKRSFEILKQYTIITTFNGDNFDFPYLHERAKKLAKDLKIRIYSPIKWNRRDKSCDFKFGLHLDLYRFYHNVAIRTYAFGNRYQEETLDAIAQGILGIGKVALEKAIFDLSEWDLVYYCSRDAKITLDLLLFENKTPLNLIFILSRISRTPIDNLVRTSVSNWVKSLFFYEHRRRGCLIPNQEDIQIIKGTQASSKAIIKGKKYKGATVIDPVPGIHFNVAVLDFASLYPSIISTFNLSYETLLCSHEECQKNKVPQTGYWVCEHNRGIVADVIGFIKDVRVQWLKPEAKKESSQKEFYQILERSLKVLINASYGVLGSDRFQFYCLPVADATTAYGRDAIEKAIQKSQALDISVLYGDTDSLFLHNPTKEQINEIIKWSKEELGVGLEMEKIYRYLVFSERKKNYFGVYPDSSVEVKGLMGKKRNTPSFLQKGFREVLAILAQVTTKEEFDEAKKQVINLIRGIYQKLEKKQYSAAELAITTQLTQPLHRYKVQAQHVKAANQLNEYYKKKNIDLVKAGQLIRFIKTRTTDRVTPLLLMTDISKVDVKAYKSMIDSTFDQLFGALDIEVEEIATGQVNLMEFFS
ncbi:MAG: DNA-directed DNA polymerase I [Candidatus Heimdallarchaeota archaeon]|nr:MAG: DNA-directed DNA polymerase I [Candidatus Heimdallarchaeota archaeon]